MNAEADLAWLKSEIEHCRRMEYTAEAQRFERIYAVLLLASAGEAGTATTTEIGVVHEHAVGEAETP